MEIFKTISMYLHGNDHFSFDRRRLLVKKEEQYKLDNNTTSRQRKKRSMTKEQN